LIGPKLDVVLCCDCEAHVCFLHFLSFFYLISLYGKEQHKHSTKFLQ